MLLAVMLGIGIGWGAGAGFTLAQRVMLSIFITAAVLWVTEAIPPFATAIGVLVACVFALGAPGAAMGFTGRRDYLVFLEPIIDPVVVLFFGGCVLALAVQKTGLDHLMARWFLKPFAKTARFFLLGVILITGFFSMFMSNTATTLMMMTLLGGALKGMERSPTLRQATVLSVAFAANIGGMGTVIGSPPNAVAVASLGKAGIEITFVEWMMLGVPISLGLLFFLWWLMIRFYRLGGTEVGLGAMQEAVAESTSPFSKAKKIWVGVVFLSTVGFWITESLHGWSASMVALLPLFLFTISGILDAGDLKKVPWDVLILVSGGLILGVGLQKTGLAERLLMGLPMEHVEAKWKLAGVLLVTILLSNFMSNTSAATILIPMVMAIPGGSSLLPVLLIAFGASLAMSLPISTPPNAIAYGTGYITSQEMLRCGTACTAAGFVILIALAFWLGTWVEGVFRLACFSFNP